MFADSTVLAYVLSELNRRHNYGLDLFLLSVDEGITGYRDDSLETVKRNEIQVSGSFYFFFFFLTLVHFYSYCALCSPAKQDLCAPCMTFYCACKFSMMFSG